MKNKYFKFLTYFILLFFYTFVYSQELPPIQRFSPDMYLAGNQNWMISQDKNKTIYTANNEGLLVYNGSNWKLYNSPNNTIIRSVKVVNEFIYTGCFMDFGYWKKNSYGNLIYNSLKPLLTDEMVEDEQIWNIIHYDELIVFRSLNRLYIYNSKTKKIKIINSKIGILKIFKVKDKIYYQEFDFKMYYISEGRSKLFNNDEVFNDVKIIAILEYNGDLLFISNNKGFFVYKNKKIVKWKIPANNFLKETFIYSAIGLKNKGFAFGTISNGIIILDTYGNIKYHINQKNGLSNNTILSLFNDVDGNLWAGLDNGINVINLKSPISIFSDDKGVLGTVYCSIIHNDYLYLGTNQGLFFKKNNTVDSFKFIKGTKGQVWSLVNVKNDLFCGHDSGLFIINNDKAELLASIYGVWDIKSIPNRNNLLLLGSYNGLFILSKNNEKWKLKNKITGFDISSRFFEFTDAKNIWVNHEYKGIYKLSLNDNLSKVTKVELDTILQKGKNSSIVNYKNELLYAQKNGVFKYNNKTKKFKKDSVLSKVIEKENYISGKLIVDKNEKLWLFSKDNISYTATNQLSNTLKINSIPISSVLRKGMIGYENISLIDNDNYLLGTSNGYLKINLSKISEKDYNINFNSIQIRNLYSKNVYLPLNEKIELKNNQNSIIFNLSVPRYDKFVLTEYQYKLNGLYKNWSKWSSNPIIKFENLKHNNYKFEVRARVGSKITNQKSFEFKIHSPWFLSKTAITFYLLALILLIVLIHRINRWYYSRQSKHKQLTNERLIMSIKNEKLNQDIESKNRELAISTMSIIKKNKVLSSVKKELTNNMTNNNIKSVIRLIDRNLNTEKDWEFFEQAFNNADKDFLKKLKNVHPKLTPNDLRFCAYLRLNLSSKEIAPLLNITVRSIEIKRYRLRKKMNLEHSESLVNHILNI